METNQTAGTPHLIGPCHARKKTTAARFLPTQSIKLSSHFQKPDCKTGCEPLGKGEEGATRPGLGGGGGAIPHPPSPGSTPSALRPAPPSSSPLPGPRPLTANAGLSGLAPSLSNQLSKHNTGDGPGKSLTLSCLLKDVTVTLLYFQTWGFIRS